MEASLTIGRLAESAQVNVETVRYYQRRGLMREPARPTGSVRRYSNDDVTRIRFIKRAQQLGFTLDEITSLLKLEDGRSFDRPLRVGPRQDHMPDHRESRRRALSPRTWCVESSSDGPIILKKSARTPGTCFRGTDTKYSAATAKNGLNRPEK